MDEKQFFEKYGKIRVMSSIDRRIPVVNTVPKDINRRIMLKFKYGNLTRVEEYEFHEKMKKLIYRVMHSNNVLMDWDDVYQEIWKKIVRCRHTWNENKGTYVSTWITIVANSVINTLRREVNRYNSRYCLYDDLVSSSINEEDADPDYMMNRLANSSVEDVLEDNTQRKRDKMDCLDEFKSSLNEAEKAFMDGIYGLEDKFIKYKDKQKPLSELQEILGYDDATFNLMLCSIRKKYCDAFEKNERMEEESSDSGVEWLF